jgi:ATP-dependent Lhr-like helicase
MAYLQEQKQAVGALPDDRTLVLERTRDELGDWRLCLLSPWGGRVHAPWSLALQAQLRAGGHGEVETIWSDDGIVIRVPDRERPPDADALLPDPDDAADLVTAELGGSSLFAAYFREAAGRALLLPRRRPGQRMALWMQRKRAHDLLQVAARFGSFPIILETFRECLQDVFDVPAFVELLRRVKRRELRLVTVDTESPSPFSASLLFGYVANYLYDGDAPLAERRAQALAVDQRQLRELLGEAELRELLDPRALAEAELQLQAAHAVAARALGRPAARPAAAHRRPLGAEIAPAPTLRQRRARVAGRARARAPRRSRSRSPARRASPPPRTRPSARRAGRAAAAGPARGVPGAGAGRSRPAGRALRAHPRRVHASRAAAALRRGRDAAAAGARGAQSRGQVLEGEFRPGGHGREWCDAAVLKELRRRSLAYLRKEVEPHRRARWRACSSTGMRSTSGARAC